MNEQEREREFVCVFVCVCERERALPPKPLNSLTFCPCVMSLDTGPTGPLRLELSNTKVHAAEKRARLLALFHLG